MDLVQKINSLIDTAKNTMKAIKIGVLAALAGTGGYVANNVVNSQPEQQVVAKEAPDDTKGSDVATLPEAPVTDEPAEEIGAKPLILYRVHFGWDYPVKIEVDDEVIPLRISAPGRPSYDVNVKIPGYMKEFTVPMENTVFEVATRLGPPSESHALALIRSRGEKLLPPRSGGEYAGLVKVEVLGEYKRKLAK